MEENVWNRGSRPENQTATRPASVTEHATIGVSVLIKGDVSGSEPLFINGAIDGSIHFADHRVTIGSSARIRAEIHAREVVVMGVVEGDIYCSDLLDVRANGSVKGQMIAKRIRIDDGATLKGKVEVHSAKRSPETEGFFRAPSVPANSASASAKPAAEDDGPSPENKFRESLLEAAASVSIAGGQPAHRVPGSRTLIEPRR